MAAELTIPPRTESQFAFAASFERETYPARAAKVTAKTRMTSNRTGAAQTRTRSSGRIILR
jgi:hypothetical protein